MASVHAAAWESLGISPYAFLTREGSAGTELPERYGAKSYDEMSQFLKAVDIVDICAPSHIHLELCLRAVEARKPTICEKPLALSVADCETIIEAFETRNVPLQVAHVLRFSPQYQAMREVIRRGEIGSPAVVRLSRLSFAPNRGSESWFSDVRKSGGLPFDLMIHDLDYARWIAGDVTSVFAKSTRGGPGHVIALLRHENRVISHIQASWAHVPPTFRTSAEVAGTKGVIGFASADTHPLDIQLHRASDSIGTGLDDLALGENPFESELGNFLDVLDGRGIPIVTARRWSGGGPVSGSHSSLCGDWNSRDRLHKSVESIMPRVGILGVAHLHVDSYIVELRSAGADVIGVFDNDRERASAWGARFVPGYMPTSTHCWRRV